MSKLLIMNEAPSYVVFRIYNELNDFISPQYRKIAFTHPFKGQVSVKDLIESLGIPHTEIDLIVVNGKSVDFRYRVRPEDHISVYPMQEGLGMVGLSQIRRIPLKKIKFIVDSHLGRLVKYLRMLGFDTLYHNNYFDSDLALLSTTEHRILLTRDRGLLKRRSIVYGHYVRHTQPYKQLQEIVQWLDLKWQIKPFYRCIRCNGLLIDVDKGEVENRLLPKTKQYYHEFKQCQDCKQVYWKGSHYQRMQRLIQKIIFDNMDLTET